MPLYKFKEGDVLRNRIKAYPKNYFLVTSGSVFYNRLNPETRTLDPGSSNYINHITKGSISLHEVNVDRPNESWFVNDLETNNLIIPFIEQSSNLVGFRSILSSSGGSNLAEKESFQFGNWSDNLTFNYPLSSSISFEYITDTGGNEDSGGRKRIKALKNTLNYYKKNSRHYSYSSSFGNKETQNIGLISIPSIFYGSSIKKGSVKLNFYVSGSLVGELRDSGRNGELKQFSPADSETGSVAGVVLYNEGFVLLTGSWSLDSHTEDYGDGSTTSKWKYWGSNYASTPSSSWGLEFEGVSYTPVITMLAHAPRGHINHSNNPTFIKHITNSLGELVEQTVLSSSKAYIEDPRMSLTNLVSASYNEPSASFKKHTYISKIGIYDENKNLIAVAKVATPVKKTEEREYTFKLKLDI